MEIPGKKSRGFFLLIFSRPNEKSVILWVLTQRQYNKRSGSHTQKKVLKTAERVEKTPILQVLNSKSKRYEN